MKILGIETSCDETAASVVEDGRKIISSVVATQFEIHKPYAGVVPELASRAHVRLINSAVEAAMRKAKLGFSGKNAIDGIAVTVGPGLVGSLLVGKMAAETLGWVHQVDVIGVNHIEGHLLSALLSDPNLKPPFLGLVVSGGHTELIYVKDWGRYELMGRTRDDAAGEAFDKVAKMLNLGFPGGPRVDKLAKMGDPLKANFPRPWLPGSWDFSFSGLKTAVLYKVKEKKSWSAKEKANLCAGFQTSVVDVLVGKTIKAAQALKVNQIIIGGGVAANSQLRESFNSSAKLNNIRLFIAPPYLCTDNAAMIASAGYFKFRQKDKSKRLEMKIQPQLHVPFMKKTPSSFSVPQ